MSEYKFLQSVAYEHLRDMIYSETFEFGVIYSETKLASQLSISRTPIRDALIRLRQERYIDILPNRGFMLHKPTEDDIMEAYHVRMAIEGYSAEILAREYDSDRAWALKCDMRDALDRQRALIKSAPPLNLRDFWLADVDFHTSMLRYVDVYAFNTQFDTFMHFFMSPSIKGFTVKGRDRSTIIEHQRILDALETGDERLAVEAVRAHLNTTLPLSLQSLD